MLSREEMQKYVVHLNNVETLGDQWKFVLEEMKVEKGKIINEWLSDKLDGEIAKCRIWAIDWLIGFISKCESQGMGALKRIKETG